MTEALSADLSPHGNLTAYNRHYRLGTEVCEACRAASAQYQRDNRRVRVKALERDERSVVPVGWPCKACVWSPRIKVSDGRIISWRLEPCRKHRQPW